MTIGRRAFVTALAGATVAGLQVGPAAAGMPQMLVPADPVLLLVDASASPAIRTGAGRALAASGLSLVQRVADDECRVLAGSVAWLAARPGRRMLGLLRDADAVLLEQMAWDCGLSCLSSAQHCQSAEAKVQSRHRITAFASNAGLGHALAGELAATGVDFAVVTDRLAVPHTALPTGEVPPITASGAGWEAALGRVLAQIAAGSWSGGTPDVARIFTGGARAEAEPYALRSFVFAS